MNDKLRIVMLVTEARGSYGPVNAPLEFGTAPQALIDGFIMLTRSQEGIASKSRLHLHSSSISYAPFDLHIVSCNPVRVEQAVTKLADNISHHSVFVPKWAWLRTGYLGCILGVRKLLKNLQPHIVHGQGTERDCAISAVFSGFPSVATIHGNMEELARRFKAKTGSFNWFAGKLENFTLPKTEGVLCNSAYTESLVGHRAKRTWRIPNAIRMDFFKSSIPRVRNEAPVLLNVGHITPRKRQVELLDMARRLHKRGCMFTIWFIGVLGEGEYGSAFKGKIAEAERLGYASYLGTKNVDELIACMDSADAMCHVPSEEAFGLVVAEGLSRNLKFFGARLGGIVDIATGVEGAELLDGDDWDGLEQAIESWIANGSIRPANAAAEMKLRYHPGVIARRHIEIYREVLGW